MLEKSFTETNKQLEKDRQIDSSLSGTTATGGVVYGPPGRRMYADCLCQQVCAIVGVGAESLVARGVGVLYRVRWLHLHGSCSSCWQSLCRLSAKLRDIVP